jgi:pimeloyl-ACP methyl ester carboxylesterase
MEYRAWGRPGGPLLLLLHALGCHGGWWDWVGPTLGEQFHVIAPDLRGHGATGPADAYGWADYASDVEALIAQVGAPAVAIAGHSMGGYVGLTVAGRQRVDLSALAVIDMKTGADEAELAAMAAAATKPSRPVATLAEAVTRYRLTPPEHRAPAERLQLVAAASFGPACSLPTPAGARQAEQTHDHPPETTGGYRPRFDRRALAIEPLDGLHLAAQVRCPSLWIRGEQSTVMDRAGALALAAAAGGTFAELPGFYHHLPLEADHHLATLLGQFLMDAAFGSPAP